VTLVTQSRHIAPCQEQDRKRTTDDFRPERSHLRGVIFALRECESDRLARGRTRPLAPDEPAFEVTVQIVLNDFRMASIGSSSTPAMVGLASQIFQEQPWA
jgi:hypothetical protein